MLTGGSMSGTWSIRACLAVSGLLVASCVLVIDPPEESGPRCLFAGHDSECGECIKARCKGETDRCCSDGACGGLIKDVESCAKDRGEACGRLSVPRQGDAKTLALCISASCAGICVQAPPTSSTLCGEIELSGGQACFCRGTDPSTANGYQCNRKTLPNTRCCAPAGYPRAGNQCTCLAVACYSVNDGCSCFLTEGFVSEGTPLCQSDICCQTEQNCRCGTTECKPGETRVSECGRDTTPCAPGQIDQPDGCSLP